MKKIKYYFNIAFINSVKWLYNHSTLFNKFLRKCARKQGRGHEMLLHMCLTDKPIDL